LTTEVNVQKGGKKGILVVSAVDVLKWDSDITVTFVNETYKAKCGQIIEVVKKTCKDRRTLGLASMIENDLKSKTGLLIGFPFSILMGMVRKEVTEKEFQFLLDQVQKWKS